MSQITLNNSLFLLKNNLSIIIKPKDYHLSARMNAKKHKKQCLN